MVTRKALTKPELDSLPVTGVRYRVPEGKVPGLYVQVGASGVKSFVMVYRHVGRQRWLTLGRYGKLTLDQARELAKSKGGEIAKGEDPASEKTAARKASNLAELAGRFLEEYCPTHLKPATEETYRSIVTRKMVPVLGTLKLDAIDAPTVGRWHQSLRKTPREANQALAILSRMLNLAESWGCRKPGLGNPCKTIQRFPENKRDRALGLSEIGSLFAAMDALEAESRAVKPSKTVRPAPGTPKVIPPPQAPPEALDCMRLILFTGARRDEIRLLTWNEVDLGSEPPVLRLRRGKEIKKGDQVGKIIALSEMAVELIKRQVPRLGNPHVFPGKDTQKRHGGPLVGLWKIWRRLLEAGNIEHATIHDLRHSFGTLAGALGLSGPLIQAALNHATPGMTARYTNLKSAQKSEVAEAVAVALRTAELKKA